MDIYIYILPGVIIPRQPQARFLLWGGVHTLQDVTYYYIYVYTSIYICIYMYIYVYYDLYLLLDVFLHTVCSRRC